MHWPRWAALAARTAGGMLRRKIKLQNNQRCRRSYTIGVQRRAGSPCVAEVFVIQTPNVRAPANVDRGAGRARPVGRAGHPAESLTRTHRHARFKIQFIVQSWTTKIFLLYTLVVSGLKTASDIARHGAPSRATPVV
jgi:hypothetical protein